jgi:hypothetical protein
MRMSILHRRLIALLALCGLLDGAVLPAWAHAFTAQRGVALPVEICTADGVRLLSAAAPASDESPAPASAVDHLKHCPFCAHTMGALAMPPLPLAWTATPLRLDPPALFLHAPRTLYPWRLAQPRAPPTFS